MSKEIQNSLPYSPQDSSSSIIHPLSEKKYADWQKECGNSILYYKGRYWRGSAFGFCEPIHWLARLNAQQINKPSPFCWEFRAVLTDDDRASANAALPVHLLSDVDAYDLQYLNSKRRNKVRKSYRKNKIFQLENLELLREQGYEVYLSASQLTGFEKSLSKEDWLAKVPYHHGGPQITLAGLVEGKLGGYLVGYAIDKVAYIGEVRLATEVLPNDIGTGLVFEFVQVCRRSKIINEIVYGLHSREDSTLCIYKESMGFPVKYIPIRTKINFLARQLIKIRYPHKYYRLTDT